MSMQRSSKNLALGFLLGAFLTGGVLGFTANRYMKRDMVCFAKNPGDQMARRLNLTPSQRVAVDSIIDEMYLENRRLMTHLRPQMDSVKRNASERILKLLDPEQDKEYELMIKEFNQWQRKNDKGQ